jgi:RecB family exonuclease
VSTVRRLNDVTPAEWSASSRAAMPKPFAWSYSSLTAFETCPWRWKLTKLTKEASETQTAATAEGNAVHKALENHLKGTVALPQSYQHLLPMVDRIKVTPGVVEAERKIALRADFTETTYFAKDVWYRGVFDVRVTQPQGSIVLDWKTGKRKVDPDQLRLFAAVEFKINPRVDTVQTGYVWLKDKKIDKETFVRDQTTEIWAEFVQRVARIEFAIKSDTFPKKPSGLCRAHCPVGRRLCEHCGE